MLYRKFPLKEYGENHANMTYKIPSPFFSFEKPCVSCDSKEGVRQRGYVAGGVGPFPGRMDFGGGGAARCADPLMAALNLYRYLLGADAPYQCLGTATAAQRDAVRRRVLDHTICVRCGNGGRGAKFGGLILGRFIQDRGPTACLISI